MADMVRAGVFEINLDRVLKVERFPGGVRVLHTDNAVTVLDEDESREFLEAVEKSRTGVEGRLRRLEDLFLGRREVGEVKSPGWSPPLENPDAHYCY